MRHMTPLQGWLISCGCLVVIGLVAPIDPYEVAPPIYHAIKRAMLIVIVSLPR